MKILAINGSPRGINGNTEVLLEQFLIGCEEAGAEKETIYLNRKHINHCSGCFSCWTKTPGKCIHKDDMEDLLLKVSMADIIVYATPLYYFTVTGLMKDFMDRTLPLFKGEILKCDDNKYGHPSRNKKQSPTKTVLISNCGFPGKYNFSGLLETFNVMTNGNLSGSILFGQGGALGNVRQDANLKELFKPYFSALRSAGKEIVTSGYISNETQLILDTNIIDSETYIKNANKNWHN
ncbi:flavodoxin family protein [Inconstantimicrobium mannanitabidum]|uniref:Flavodoxin family protein n=1 Tax=Inconstantimicrobium mannanitabidum TaxID=1604901 RepID=A0ACB5RHG2_9CLOT|nr:flavodoxin family protein [Clostridium sp. TW13]GKX68525.1 flavodoxin family protein [Clostridium sp. TW13]